MLEGQELANQTARYIHYKCKPCNNKRKWGTHEGHWGRWLGLSIPQKLFLVSDGNWSLFPQTYAKYLSLGDQGILKGRSARKNVLSLEAASSHILFAWNKDAGRMKKDQSLSHENLNQRKKRWQQERIYLLLYVYKQHAEKYRIVRYCFNLLRFCKRQKKS